MRKHVALALVTSLLAVPGLATTASTATADPAPAAAARQGPPVTVMSRNIYLGADIQRPLRAVAGKTGLEALVALGNENAAVFETVQQTSFPTRSELLADEIAGTKPDLVGLQEVALWRHGPLELGQLGVPNAEEVDYDFLALLLADLAERGARYRAVEVTEEADTEAPAFTGNPFTGVGFDPTTAVDRRLTMHDVILKRVGSPVQVTDSGGGNFDARLSLSIAGLPAEFVRGYAWADVRSGDTAFRFVTTHLEAFGSLIALRQAQELLDGPLAYDGTVVLVGDLNSDPLDGSTDSTGVPHWAPYRLLTGAGLVDQWLVWAPAEEGWTSGLSETVDDPTAVGFDHRIDFVLARTAAGEGLRVDRGEITGDEVTDRDPATGLWPSDHAGVVTTLRGIDSR